MDTTTIKERELQEEALFEEDAENQEEAGMTDEELKIESLKIATNIGKLMNNVTTEDIVNIAETVAKFIKGGDNASLETTGGEEESEEDFEESPEEETEDTEENFETEEGESEGESEGEEKSKEEEEPEEDFEV